VDVFEVARYAILDRHLLLNQEEKSPESTK